MRVADRLFCIFVAVAAVDAPATATGNPADFLHVEVGHMAGPVGDDPLWLAVVLAVRVKESALAQPQPREVSGDGAAVDHVKGSAYPDARAHGAGQPTIRRSDPLARGRTTRATAKVPHSNRRLDGHSSDRGHAESSVRRQFPLTHQRRSSSQDRVHRQRAHPRLPRLVERSVTPTAGPELGPRRGTVSKACTAKWSLPSLEQGRQPRN